MTRFFFTFLIVNNIPLCLYAIFLKLFYPLMSIQLFLPLGYYRYYYKDHGCVISLRVPDFGSLDICPEMGLLDLLVALFLIFWETFILFTTVVAPFCIPPTAWKGYNFSTFSQHLLFFHFYNDHPNGCDVVSHCGFWFAFL